MSLKAWQRCAASTVLGAFASACAHVTVAPIAGDYAFTGVTVVDVANDRLLERRTVVVDDGAVVHIGAAGEAIAPGVTIIDGAGRYLAPGLADMHVHVWDEHEPQLYVSYGVTTVRNMWGEGVTLDLRHRIESGEIIGPRMVTAGPIVDGSPKIWPTSVEVATPEAARAEARAQIEAGYDFIKVYSNLSLESFDAIALTARAAGMPFAGHVPEQVTIRHALDEGMATMEHLYGFDAATVRPGVSLGSGRFSSPERVAIARRLLADETTLDEVFDAEALEALASEIAATETRIVPTLIVGRQLSMTRAEARLAFARPEVAYVLPRFRALWNPDSDFRRRGSSDEDLAALQVYRRIALARVGALHRAGARLLAGTDAPNPFVFHGSSLHEELSLLVEAGLRPIDAIRAATMNPADFLGEAGEWGVVAEGARADLVLLTANPLRDVANYRAIEGVMVRGRWLQASDLSALRDATAAAFSAMGAWEDTDPSSVRTGWPIDEH